MKSNCQSRPLTFSSLFLHLVFINLLLHSKFDSSSCRLLYLLDANNQSSMISDEQSPSDEAVYIGPTHVVEDNSVTIRCVLSIFQSPVWSLNGQLLQLDQLVHIESQGEHPITKYLTKSESDSQRNSRSEFLTIRRSTFVDSGDYKCTQFGKRAHSLQVLVQDWSRFGRQLLPTLNYQLRFPGEHVILFCDLGTNDQRVNKNQEKKEEEDAGFGIMVLHKDDNGVETVDSSDQFFSTTTSPSPALPSNTNSFSDPSFEQRLQWSHWSEPVHEWTGLNRVLVNRSGVFVCQLNDQQQRFYVFEPASIHNFRRKQHAKPTLTMELECEPNGYPRPTIQWFIGNTKVDPSQERFANVELVPNLSGYSNAVLRIRNSSSEDSNTYTCKAQHQIDRERFEAEDSIQVYISEQVIEANPTTTLSLYGITKVRCTILSQEETIDHWLFNNTRIVPDNKKYKLEDDNQSLIIHKCNYNDEGMYRCVASNGQFHDQLVVSVPKLKFKEGPNINMNYLSAYVMIGQDVQIFCSAYSQFSVNKYLWKYEDEPVNKSYVLLQSNGLQLAIRNLSRQHAGKYACNVTNEVGSEEKVLILRIYDPYSYVWPLTGIAIMICILFSCIFCCPEKKKRRPHTD